MVTFTATDADGNVSQCSATVTVQDTTPPNLVASLDPEMLWPADKQLHDITADVMVTDVCDPQASFLLTKLISSEPDDGKSDGNTTGDIAGHDLGTADTSFQLRAERSASGTGRTYTATYAAADVSGNSSVQSAEVVVPRNAVVIGTGRPAQCADARQAGHAACRSLSGKAKGDCMQRVAAEARECLANR